MAELARPGLGRQVAEHELGKAERGRVARVDSRLVPVGERRAWRQHRHPCQPAVQVSQCGPCPVRQARHSEHATKGGAQQLVLSDVDGELVVGHLDGQQLPRPAGQLVSDSDASPHSPQRLVHRAVALKHARSEGGACQPHERLGERGPKVVVGGGLDQARLEARVAGVPEKKQHASQPHTLLGADVDLKVVDTSAADQAAGRQPPAMAFGPHVQQPRGRQRLGLTVVEGDDDPVAVELVLLDVHHQPASASVSASGSAGGSTRRLSCWRSAVSPKRAWTAVRSSRP